MAENSEAMARVPVRRHEGDAIIADFDTVAEEVPVALEYNGISHAVLLASPLDLEDLALGFSLTEGIADTICDISDIEIVAAEAGIRVGIRISGHCFARLKKMRRSMAGRTGCGLCGVESLRHVRRSITPLSSSVAIDLTCLRAASRKLTAMQHMHQLTGATHAAAWVLPDGGIATIREDIGRHNALDKLIGSLACDGTNFATGAVLITSRASYEMVQKAAAVGIGTVAAISAPTAFAIRVARELKLNLIGFFRLNRQVEYSTMDKPLRKTAIASREALPSHEILIK